jgi:hypothetical protein
MRITIDFPSDILAKNALRIISSTFGHEVVDLDRSELVVVMTDEQAELHLAQGRRVVQFDTRLKGSRLVDTAQLTMEVAGRYRGFRILGDAGYDETALFQYLKALATPGGESPGNAANRT